MAANCPAATPSLLRGCVGAYKLAERYEALSSGDETRGARAGEAGARRAASDSSEARDVMRTSAEAARRLASLSRRETLGAICALNEHCAMDGLALSLLMDHDPIQATSFVVGALGPDAGAGSLGTLDARRRRSGGGSTLRQRMVNGKTLGAARPSSAGGASTSPRLRKELDKDGALSDEVQRFVSRRIMDMLKADEDGEVAGSGGASLFVRAYASLVRSVGVGATSSAGSGARFVKDTMAAIARLSEGGCPRLDSSWDV